VKPYLSICAIYNNEGVYLREWIEFHRLVGVERFFLYDNASDDDHEAVLEPYVADGTVVLERWPQFPGQKLAYNDCLDRRGDESRWIAFIDLDEFLFSPTGRPLPELLVDFERWPGVGVNWCVFGNSGHRTPPPGLVIENYLRRRQDAVPRHRQIKSIVDPKRADRSLSPHNFRYLDKAFAVDENQRPIAGPQRAMTDEVSFSRLRVNHYWTRSAEEWSRKLTTLEPWTGTPRQSYERRALTDLDRLERALNEHYDDTITMYAPALREALGMEPAAARGSSG
jgi:hypothetical protein